MGVLASFIKFRFFALMALLLSVVASGCVTFYCQVVMGQINPHSCYFYVFVNRWVIDAIWICYICAIWMLNTNDSRKIRPRLIGEFVTTAIWVGLCISGRTGAKNMANLAKVLGKADTIDVVLFYWSIAQVVQWALIVTLDVGEFIVAMKMSSKQKIKQHLKLSAKLSSSEPRVPKASLLPKPRQSGKTQVSLRK